MSAAFIHDTGPLTETTAQGVVAVISEVVGKPIASINPTHSLIGELTADSLDTAELVIALEDEFDIIIPDEEWERVVTVQDAIDVVNRYVIRAAGPKRHGVPA